MPKLLFLFIFLLYPIKSLAIPFEPQADYSVCFTPGDNCTKKIIAAIDNAKNNIWVQAYSFTSRPIGKALVTAQERGVQVQIIFDKSIFSQKKTLQYFKRHGIPIWIDERKGIAHNKVMIIDQTEVITGSFNFTNAAQYKNAENVLFIDDKELAKKYLQNWQKRQQAAKGYNIHTTQLETSDWEQSEFLEAIIRWLQKWS